jgi:hypothetical protein
VTLGHARWAGGDSNAVVIERLDRQHAAVALDQKEMAARRVCTMMVPGASLVR